MNNIRTLFTSTINQSSIKKKSERFINQWSMKLTKKSFMMSQSQSSMSNTSNSLRNNSRAQPYTKNSPRQLCNKNLCNQLSTEKLRPQLSKEKIPSWAKELFNNNNQWWCPPSKSSCQYIPNISANHIPCSVVNNVSHVLNASQWDSRTYMVNIDAQIIQWLVAEIAMIAVNAKPIERNKVVASSTNSSIRTNELNSPFSNNNYVFESFSLLW